ncbi:MAG TPA: hypothetical protein VJP85_04530 [Candidatus Baltobacteraceae bacterium]|nr:hypothetical protein [Candidatus Baltobacteraceae bacterium]
MFHLLIAGLVLISGSQTTTASHTFGHVGANGGGAIYRVSVQTQHVSNRPPVNTYEQQQRQQAQLLARTQYCWVRRKVGNGYMLVFQRVSGAVPACSAAFWQF